MKSIKITFVQKFKNVWFVTLTVLMVFAACNKENTNIAYKVDELNIAGYWSGNYQRRQTFDSIQKPIGVLFKDNDSAIYYNLSPTLDTSEATNKYDIKYLIRNDSLFINIDEEPILRFTQYFGRIDTSNNSIDGFFNKLDLSGAIPSASTIFNGNFNLQKN